MYVVLYNYKRGDFKPYVVKSTDRGHTWSSIAGNLPSEVRRTPSLQDHEKADLLFVGTEFGLFFTLDGGAKWIQLKGGLPTIAVRDLEIQRRENDLAVGTFGRGFYILDDYTPLRELSNELLEKDRRTSFPSKRPGCTFKRIRWAEVARRFRAPVSSPPPILLSAPPSPTT